MDSKFIDFPPFFTQQPNVETFEKQVEEWCQVILKYCKSNKIFQLPLTQTEPFVNHKINRKLSIEMIKYILLIRIIIDRLVSVKRAEIKDSNQCFIFYYTLQEWADMIYKHIFDTGRCGTIITLYELLNSSEYSSQEFFKANDQVILKALNILQNQDKLVLITSNDGNTGIKFK